MTTISNIFSESDNLKKTKTKTKASYSLSQGKKFEAYQKKVTFNLDKKAKKLSEGFQGFQGSNYGLTSQSNSLLQETDFNSQKQTIDNLKVEYDSTLKEYKNLINQIEGTVQGYLERVDTNNPYLNKTVRFTTGHIAYVTGKGVVKYVPNMDIWASTGIPTTYIDLNIPWKDSYGTQGTLIESTPPLVAGTFLQQNQTIGNEGSNVFVDKFLSDSVDATYKGCYADNTSSPLMTFIGGAPPQPSILVNGDFSQPQLANNSYKRFDNGSDVPGWWFGSAFIANNSSDWFFPLPYPSGNQCLVLQTGSYVSQTVYLKTGITYTLSWISCGRDCCDGSHESNPINVQLYVAATNGYISTIYNFQPPANVWTNYTTSFTVETSQNTKIFFSGTWASTDRATAVQNIRLTDGGTTNDTGSYTYDQCKQSATGQGYQYFALQHVNTSTSQGYCAVSNSEPTVTSLGESKAVTGQFALWASNTAGQTGNTATLTTTGALSLLNPSGQSVFSTDNSSAQPGNYLGCYNDHDIGGGTRVMAMQTGGSQQYSYDQCKKIAQDQGANYFGLQNSTSGTNAQCVVGNDLAQAREYGKAGNCTKTGDGYSGGGWSNAVYQTTQPGSIYFLSVQGDGNVCIYRGSGPSDNQGNIWCSGTNGKGQSPNPNMTAAKGKYGKDWISSGDTLAAGDFVGSSDGTFALIMQTDGNLVLYTFSLGSNCKQMADGNTGAGAGGNALYGLPKASIPGNMGKMGYIDENSELSNIPSSNFKKSTNYLKLSNMAYPQHGSGNGVIFNNFASLQDCNTYCNENGNCGGYAYYNDWDAGACVMYTPDVLPPNTELMSFTGTDVYLNIPELKTVPKGASNKVVSTDSVTFQNYINAGEIKKSYGLSKANSVQKQQLSDLETRLDLITSEINKFTSQFEQDGSKIDNQLISNIPGTQKYLKEIGITNSQIQNSSFGLDRVLDDSDIVVLQKNYDYLFWSILAAGTVLISMNIVKKA